MPQPRGRSGGLAVPVVLEPIRHAPKYLQRNPGRPLDEPSERTVADDEQAHLRGRRHRRRARLVREDRDLTEPIPLAEVGQLPPIAPNGDGTVDDDEELRPSRPSWVSSSPSHAMRSSALIATSMSSALVHSEKSGIRLSSTTFSFLLRDTRRSYARSWQARGAVSRVFSPNIDRGRVGTAGDRRSELSRATRFGGRYDPAVDPATR